MKRRDFLYLAGVGGAGVVVLGSDSKTNSSATDRFGDHQAEEGVHEPLDAQLNTELTAHDDETPTGDEPVGVSLTSRRVVLPAGAALSLSTGAVRIAGQAEHGDLQFTAYREGAATLDVVGGLARIAPPLTKNTLQFQRRVNHAHFPIPNDRDELCASETVLYTAEDAARLSRPSAANTLVFVLGAEEKWHAVHIAEVASNQIVLEVLEQALPIAA